VTLRDQAKTSRYLSRNYILLYSERLFHAGRFHPNYKTFKNAYIVHFAFATHDDGADTLRLPFKISAFATECDPSISV